MRQVNIDRLYELRLHGMRQALKDQSDTGACETLAFDERLGLLIEAEDDWRLSQRIHVRVKKAKLRQNARRVSSHDDLGRQRLLGEVQ